MVSINAFQGKVSGYYKDNKSNEYNLKISSKECNERQMKPKEEAFFPKSSEEDIHIHQPQDYIAWWEKKTDDGEETEKFILPAVISTTPPQLLNETHSARKHRAVLLQPSSGNGSKSISFIFSLNDDYKAEEPLISQYNADFNYDVFDAKSIKEASTRMIDKSKISNNKIVDKGIISKNVILNEDGKSYDKIAALLYNKTKDYEHASSIISEFSGSKCINIKGLKSNSKSKSMRHKITDFKNPEINNSTRDLNRNETKMNQKKKNRNLKIYNDSKIVNMMNDCFVEEINQINIDNKAINNNISHNAKCISSLKNVFEDESKKENSDQEENVSFITRLTNNANRETEKMPKQSPYPVKSFALMDGGIMNNKNKRLIKNKKPIPSNDIKITDISHEDLLKDVRTNKNLGTVSENRISGSNPNTKETPHARPENRLFQTNSRSKISNKKENKKSVNKSDKKTTRNFEVSAGKNKDLLMKSDHSRSIEEKEETNGTRSCYRKFHFNGDSEFSMPISELCHKEFLKENEVEKKKRVVRKKELKPLVHFLNSVSDSKVNTKEKLAKFNLGDAMTYTLYGTNYSNSNFKEQENYSQIREEIREKEASNKIEMKNISIQHIEQIETRLNEEQNKKDLLLSIQEPNNTSYNAMNQINNVEILTKQKDAVDNLNLMVSTDSAAQLQTKDSFRCNTDHSSLKNNCNGLNFPYNSCFPTTIYPGTSFAMPFVVAVPSSNSQYICSAQPEIPMYFKAFGMTRNTQNNFASNFDQNHISLQKNLSGNQSRLTLGPDAISLSANSAMYNNVYNELPSVCDNIYLTNNKHSNTQLTMNESPIEVKEKPLHKDDFHEHNTNQSIRDERKKIAIDSSSGKNMADILYGKDSNPLATYERQTITGSNTIKKISPNKKIKSITSETVKNENQSNQNRKPTCIVPGLYTE